MGNNDALAEGIGGFIDNLKKRNEQLENLKIELIAALEYYAAIKGPIGEPARVAITKAKTGE